MLVTNYNQYHGLKPKYSEEFMLNPRLMKEAKLRKHKSSIYRIQEALRRTYLVLKQSCSNFLKNIGIW